MCVWLQSSVIEMLLDNEEEIMCEVYNDSDSDSASVRQDNVSVNILYCIAGHLPV